DLPIGKNLWIKRDNKGLIAKTQYANHAEADKVYQYRKDGFPLAQSIGFVPLAWETFKDGDRKDGARRKFTKWAMLEYSDVPVPANPEATPIAVSKGFNPVKEEVTKMWGVIDKALAVKKVADEKIKEVAEEAENIEGQIEEANSIIGWKKYEATLAEDELKAVKQAYDNWQKENPEDLEVSYDHWAYFANNPYADENYLKDAWNDEWEIDCEGTLEDHFINWIEKDKKEDDSEEEGKKSNNDESIDSSGDRKDLENSSTNGYISTDGYINSGDLSYTTW
ncbi:unnamed protein product, partial [marine sediment metagenome]